ncbi:hypothetical protein BC332_34511 [Capsicum chinense]|nr:hypothetical protein BC332_34511 [Capsicum chinense]
MANYSFYVRCFVPGCESTSITTPTKIFFNVPRGNERERWSAAVGVRRTLSKSTPHRCCEDHFNLETDLKDKFKLKKGILPHINIPNNTAEVLLPTCDSNASPQIVAKTDDHQILQIHDRPNSPRISNFSDETEIEASHQQLNATSASTFSHKPVAKASHQQLFAASMSTCSHDSVARSSHQQQDCAVLIEHRPLIRPPISLLFSVHPKKLPQISDPSSKAHSVNGENTSLILA